MFSFEFLRGILARGCQKMYSFAHARRLTAVLHSALHKGVTAMLYNVLKLLVSSTANEILEIGFSSRKYDNDVTQLPLASTLRMRTSI